MVQDSEYLTSLKPGSSIELFAEFLSRLGIEQIQTIGRLFVFDRCWMLLPLVFSSHSTPESSLLEKRDALPHQRKLFGGRVDVYAKSQRNTLDKSCIFEVVNTR
eukprot:TRINITY_DN10416_c0_g1_i2.p5 TRINITY_DN10416_c0_g1~~TRINITY_DN10416_c0_g1_i2.p5  ORF type:complete len:104 (+),score=6.48 TRINITY_DN10416_c0_g1_i2:1100-1411(+)